MTTPAARLVHLLHSSAKELEELSHDAQGRDELCKHLDQITEATFAMFIVRNRIEARDIANIGEPVTVTAQRIKDAARRPFRVVDCQGEKV